MKTVHIFDTTMRDGAQQEGLNLSVQDKLHIAQHLDDLGVDFIEGGWPGAIPKDTEFFRRATTELDFKHATLVAFGSMGVQISLIHRQQRLDRLNEQIDAIQMENKELRQTESRLQSPSEILRIARDELGMVESRPPELVTPAAEVVAPAGVTVPTTIPAGG